MATIRTPAFLKIIQRCTAKFTTVAVPCEMAKATARAGSALSRPKPICRSQVKETSISAASAPVTANLALCARRLVEREARWAAPRHVREEAAALYFSLKIKTL